MSAICGHCGEESPTVMHKCPTSTAPPVTFSVRSFLWGPESGHPDSVELRIESEGMATTFPTMTPEFASQLAAELVFIASRVAGKDMRPVFNRHLRDRKAGAR